MQASKHFSKFREVKSGHWLLASEACFGTSENFWPMQKYRSALGESDIAEAAQEQSAEKSPHTISTKRAKLAAAPGTAEAHASATDPKPLKERFTSTRLYRKHNAHSRLKANADSKPKGNADSRAAAAPLHKMQYEIPAALADPLAAYAYQAGCKQRALQSGLSLLKGKTSQACLLPCNLQPLGQPTQPTADQHKLRQDSNAVQHGQDQISQQQQAQQKQPKNCAGVSSEAETGALQVAQSAAEVDSSSMAVASQAASLQKPVKSTSKLMQRLLTPQDKAATQTDSYFANIKSSLHRLIQAHDAVPSLQTMSTADRAVLTSLLDCTPSPESVAQQQSRVQQCRQTKPAFHTMQHKLLPHTHFTTHSYASAASSGSGHNDLPGSQLDSPVTTLPQHSWCDLPDSFWKGPLHAYADAEPDEVAFAEPIQLEWYACSCTCCMCCNKHSASQLRVGELDCIRSYCSPCKISLQEIYIRKRCCMLLLDARWCLARVETYIDVLWYNTGAMQKVQTYQPTLPQSCSQMPLLSWQR